MGSYVHSIILPVLSARLWAIGLPNDYEVPTVPGGSKNLKSEVPEFSDTGSRLYGTSDYGKTWTHRGYLDPELLGLGERGKVDLAIFIPDTRHSGQHVAWLYELKPDHVARARGYRSEVNHYLDYFPPVHRWKAPIPPWPPVTWKISRKSIGPSLAALRIAPAVFDPIIIESDVAALIIHFGPPPASEDGLLVYRTEPRRRRPGEPSMARQHLERTLQRLQVDTRGSFQVRLPVVASQVVIGGAMLAWAATGVAALLAVQAPAAIAAAQAAYQADTAARLANALRVMETARRVRIAAETARAAGGAVYRIAGSGSAAATEVAAEAEAIAAASQAAAVRTQVLNATTQVMRTVR
jgi:hypothetical protein